MAEAVADPGVREPVGAVRSLIRPKVLYLGSGGDTTNPAPHLFPDYEVVRLDVDENAKPDILLDMTKLTDLPAESFEGVASSHSLEHVSAHEVPVVLAGIKHVLRRSGQVSIRVPDVKKAAKILVECDWDMVVYHSPAGPIRPLDMLYGYAPMIAAGMPWMCHKTGFTATLLRKLLEDAGFIRVQVDEGPYTWTDLIATAMKP
jgi:predicted SAM-dependent methyltransferase